MSEKFKLIHLTDIHWNPLNRIPQSRTKAFHDQIEAKWSYITNLIQKDSTIKAGLLSGDIFHLKSPHYYIPEYVMYYADFLERTSPFPWYSIPGNHDLPKSSYSLYKSSPYALLTRATQNLTDISLKTFLINKSPGVYVTGLPFLPLEQTMQQLPKLNEHISAYPGFNILLLHADAMPDDSIQLFWDTVGYDQILDAVPNVDLICLGHIHASFPIYSRVNPTTGRSQLISKPWSFSRVARDYFNKTDILEKQHKPSYSLITFEIEKDKFQVNVSYHEIPHESFKKAFKQESLQKQAEMAGNLKSFIEAIKEQHGTSQEAMKFSNPEDYMKEAKISNEVRELIFEYLGES